MNDLDEFYNIVGTNHLGERAEREIIDFLVFITSYPSIIKIGASEDASGLLELYNDWKDQRKRGLRNPHEDYDDFSDLSDFD